MPVRNAFLDTAERIGDRLIENAVWNDRKCSWKVITPQLTETGPPRPREQAASGGIYQGTAGISLFLARLYWHTRKETLTPVIEAAVRHALDQIDEFSPNAFGFYAGRVGVAFAAAVAGQILGQADFVKQAQEILASLQGKEREDRRLDFLAGAAGAIPALLNLAAHLEKKWIRRMAHHLGDHLIKTARPEPVGWSWEVSPACIRNLTGLAHGAAGFGHALLELYVDSGEARFLYAARQAFAYENQHFNGQMENWPDFRHQMLGTLFSRGRLSGLKQGQRARNPLPKPLGFASAWCHGAPGIGLTRIRAYQILQDPVFREDALAASRTAERSLQTDMNYSLCHGQAGNGETLIWAAEILGEAAFRNRVEACALQARQDFELSGLGWPCGTVDQVSDPSLMLGEAGIGYFYLRLFSPGTPSLLLLVHPGKKAGGFKTDPQGCNKPHRRYLEAYFPTTVGVIERFAQSRFPALQGSLNGIWTRLLDAHQTFRHLKERIESEPHPIIKPLLEDAFRPERIAFELTLAMDDFTEELLEGLLRRTATPPDWRDVEWTLNRWTRIVSTERDWTEWLRESRPNLPDPSGCHHLLFRRRNWIHLQKVDDFTAAVLRLLEDPVRGADIPGVIRRSLPPLQGPVPDEKWKASIEELLLKASLSGIVRYRQSKD